MRVKMLTFLVVSLISVCLTGCGNTPIIKNQDDGTTNNNSNNEPSIKTVKDINDTYRNNSDNVQISPSVVNTPKTENDYNSSNVTPSDKQVLSPMQALKAVLLNEITFFCTDKTPYYNLVNQWNGYLNELAYDSNPIITPQFAVVDLDGDSVPEIVLAIENYNGFVLLRYKEGNVYGNIVSYRTMYNLKKDGSFKSSSGSSDNSMGKMLIIGDTFFCDQKVSSIGGPNIDSYYIHDMPIDKDTWDERVASFDDLPDVEWHEYSKKGVNQWLLDDSSFLKITTTDRQNYLNSLAYLIDLTNSNIKSQEEANANARSYYNGCNDEMNKIYQLCLEKLSGDELEALSTEQQRWKENFNRRLSGFLSDHLVNSMDDLTDQSGYYEYGDMMLRRTFSLINLYYDNDFYD